MSASTRHRRGVSALLLVAVAFIAAVILSNALFSGLRLDLTENRLYTLSDGTKNIVRAINEPIDLYFYFSDEATANVPSLRDYATRVREMLEEFEAASRGGIRLSVIDPVPFSEDEDDAAQFGLQDVQLSTVPDPVYLGLAGTNSVGDEEIIPFFQPDRQSTLEYDVAKLVSRLANPEPVVVGLVSGVSMSGNFNPQLQRMEPAWIVYEQARQLFTVRDLGTDFESVPDDIGVLWIVQPKGLSDTTQYAIDQFVMRGGRALIFVDPLAVVDAASAPGMPQGMPPTGQASDLPALFDGWGIAFDAASVVADAGLALQLSGPRGGRPTRHYGYLGISRPEMSDDDIVTMELGSANVAMAGSLRAGDDATFEFTPLLSSSTQSATMPSSRFTFMMDPTELQRGFAPDGEVRTIAARIGGSMKSAFPDGPPEEPLPTTESDDEGDGEGAATDVDGEHLAESSGPVNLIVVADVDMLGDSLWVSVQNFFGQQVASAFAGNGAFVINAIESLAGSADLISVRSRSGWSRPFTRVEELRAAAEARFLETEQRLQQELADTERRLGELQAARDDTGSLLLTDEQQAEIDRFVEQRASIRKELRAVQRGLDEDIDRLGTVLKVINIGLVPFLLTVGMLFALWRRRERDT